MAKRVTLNISSDVQHSVCLTFFRTNGTVNVDLRPLQVIKLVDHLLDALYSGTPISSGTKASPAYVCQCVVLYNGRPIIQTLLNSKERKSVLRLLAEMRRTDSRSPTDQVQRIYSPERALSVRRS